MKNLLGKGIKGFTLVELVLVISIVVVLSVISGPIYRSYAYKARQAEGYALIGTIRSAQESYFGEYGEFYTCSTANNRSTCNDDILGIDARPNKYYTTFCSNLHYLTDGRVRYMFRSIAYGNGAANVVMYYNRTSGITMQSGVSLEALVD